MIHIISSPTDHHQGFFLQSRTPVSPPPLPLPHTNAASLSSLQSRSSPPLLPLQLEERPLNHPKRKPIKLIPRFGLIQGKNSTGQEFFLAGARTTAGITLPAGDGLIPKDRSNNDDERPVLAPIGKAHAFHGPCTFSFGMELEMEPSMEPEMEPLNMVTKGPLLPNTSSPIHHRPLIKMQSTNPKVRSAFPKLMAELMA